MKTPIKILIIAALAVAVAAAIVLKEKKGGPPLERPPVPVAAGTNTSAAVATAKLPRLVDLGAGKCIPCKMMTPILEELKRDYAAVFVTEFIDVWENPDAGKPYNIEMIPTQIFFNAEGGELFRHTGFFAKEDILAKWKELGVAVPGKE